MKKKLEVINPREAVRIAKGLIADEHQYKENFIALYLSARNTVNRKEVVSIGTLSASLVHCREVFRPAFLSRAASLIVLHNHPSGAVEPSAADIEVTSRLKKAGEIFGIELIDHVIFDSSDKFYSFRDNNAI